MTLRLALSVVFVGTLASACGPGTRSDVAVDGEAVAPQGFTLASMGGAGMRSTNAVEKTIKSGSATLATSFDIAQSGDQVRFAFRVVNKTPKNVEVNFPTGQAYDFVVLDSVGREVWRWADGRIFTQSVRNKLLGKGESITLAETWAPAKPGKFTAVAMLRSSNYPIEQKIVFEHR
jgi:hypothetical protein